MKKQNPTRPSRSPFSVLRQLCNFTPSSLVPNLARQTGVDRKARTFSPWSHLVSLIYAQHTHAIGFSDVCDAPSMHIRTTTIFHAHPLFLVRR